MFSLAVLAVALFRVFNHNPDEAVGPVMVPLYESTDDISLRGLHATDDTVVVVGGNEGVFGFSLDAGVHWIFTQLPGAESSQFRSVWAHDDHRFVAVSAGAPSYVYYSKDRGQSWQRTFEDTASATFLDGIQFINDTLGYIYGDPVNGRFKLLRTTDGGRNWMEIEGPEAIDGEASFAASGSAITMGNNLLTIVSGGSVSRLHVTMDGLNGSNWLSSPIELRQGLPSQGAFAHHWVGEKLFIVGGDYMNDEDTTMTCLVADMSTGQDDRATMNALSGLPYTSDVSSDGDYVYFTGTTGVRYFDSTLHVMDTTTMHALAFSGKHVFASGPQGRIGRVFTGTVADLNKLLEQIESARKP